MEFWLTHSARITGLDQTAGRRMSGYKPEEVIAVCRWPHHPSGTAMAASSLTRSGPDLGRIHSVGRRWGGKRWHVRRIEDVVGAVSLTG
jgi:hypothetical protein